jgi:hypothetical protein
MSTLTPDGPDGEPPTPAQQLERGLDLLRAARQDLDGEPRPLVPPLDLTRLGRPGFWEHIAHCIRTNTTPYTGATPRDPIRQDQAGEPHGHRGQE